MIEKLEYVDYIFFTFLDLGKPLRLTFFLSESSLPIYAQNAIVLNSQLFSFSLKQRKNVLERKDGVNILEVNECILNNAIHYVTESSMNLILGTLLLLLDQVQNTKKQYYLLLNCFGLVNLASAWLELMYRDAHTKCKRAKTSLFPAHLSSLKLKMFFALIIFQLFMFVYKEVIPGVVYFLAVPASLHYHSQGLFLFLW